MSLVCALIASLPFCSTRIARFWGSSISSLVTIQGPRPVNVSNPFGCCACSACPVPRIALAEIPQNGVAEDVVERLVLCDVPRGPADHGAKLALEVHVLETFGSTTGPPGPMMEEDGLRKNSAMSSSLLRAERSDEPIFSRISAGAPCSWRRRPRSRAD